MKLLICLVATFADAMYVTVAYVIAHRVADRRQIPFLMVAGVLTAISVEVLAQRLNIWGYSELMPVIPVVHVGLSPALQLAITSIAAFAATRDALDETAIQRTRP
jgi:predicted membrane protein